MTEPSMDEMVEGLRAIRAGKSLGDDPKGLRWAMLANELIRDDKVMKPCRSCGMPQVDYHYTELTAAGRYLLLAFDNQSTRSAGSAEQAPASN